MEITITTKDRILVVAINGDIDHHTATLIKERSEKEYTLNGSRDMILDFSDVSFMDSSGIGMIIGRYKNVESNGGRLVVFGASKNVSRIFTMSGLGKIIKVCSTLQEAIDFLKKEV